MIDLPPPPVVSMHGRVFAPAHVSVLVGERVTWRNTDTTTHLVVASEAGLDSGRIPPGAGFEHRFERAGTVRYLCTIHRGMRGVVEVASIALTGPARAVRPGAEVRLTGRAPAGTGPLTVIGPDAPATVEPAADGTFAFAVRPSRPASYRVVAGRLSSVAARVAVAPPVALAARRHGGAVSVRVHVPGQAGARVVLERHVRERFAFVALRRLTLDRHGRARIVLRTPARMRLRARLARPVGGFARARSGPVLVLRRVLV